MAQSSRVEIRRVSTVPLGTCLNHNSPYLLSNHWSQLLTKEGRVIIVILWLRRSRVVMVLVPVIIRWMQHWRTACQDSDWWTLAPRWIFYFFKFFDYQKLSRMLETITKFMRANFKFVKVCFDCSDDKLYMIYFSSFFKKNSIKLYCYLNSFKTSFVKMQWWLHQLMSMDILPGIKQRKIV